MNHRALPLVIGSILLALGCGGDTDRGDSSEAQILRCSDQPDAAIATFEDANLEARVRFALSVGDQEDLTCGLVSGLTTLDANFSRITSLVGIQTSPA